MGANLNIRISLKWLIPLAMGLLAFTGYKVAWGFAYPLNATTQSDTLLLGTSGVQEDAELIGETEEDKYLYSASVTAIREGGTDPDVICSIDCGGTDIVGLGGSGGFATQKDIIYTCPAADSVGLSCIYYATGNNDEIVKSTLIYSIGPPTADVIPAIDYSDLTSNLTILYSVIIFLLVFFSLLFYSKWRR